MEKKFNLLSWDFIGCTFRNIRVPFIQIRGASLVIEGVSHWEKSRLTTVLKGIPPLRSISTIESSHSIASTMTFVPLFVLNTSYTVYVQL